MRRSAGQCLEARGRSQATQVESGQTLAMIESMKMEIAIAATVRGVVRESCRSSRGRRCAPATWSARWRRCDGAVSARLWPRCARATPRGRSVAGGDRRGAGADRRLRRSGDLHQPRRAATICAPRRASCWRARPTRASCRSGACPSRSRTISTSPACRPRPPVRTTPMSPARIAAVVARLRAAGALLIGKTNLDQFATGLNGTRSPYGAPRCVFNTRLCLRRSSLGLGGGGGARAGGALRSAPIRPARAACRRRSTTSSASSRRRAWSPVPAWCRPAAASIASASSPPASPMAWRCAA